MAEFKIICPQCKQHIQCDTSHVGLQINCPACQQAIIVPPAPPKFAASDERTIHIKVSTLRKSTLIGLCVLLTAGVVAFIIYARGDFTRTIWTEWSVLDGGGEQWSLANGKIHGHSVDGEAILASEEKYRELTYSATISTTNREASLAIRMQDAGNGYLILFAPARTPCPWNRTGFIAVIKKVAGGETTLASYNKRNMFSIGHAAQIKVMARGPIIEVQVNGTKILHVSDSTFATGRIACACLGL